MSKRSASVELCAASSPDAEVVHEPPMGTADDWRRELEISEAQLAAGDVVDSAEVKRELDDAIARMKAKKAATPPR